MNPAFIFVAFARRAHLCTKHGVALCSLALTGLALAAQAHAIEAATTFDNIPGKKSDSFELARAQAKAAERQRKLAQLDAEARAGEAKVGDAKDPKRAATPSAPIEHMSDGTVRLRPSADPQKAIDAIRERLSDRGVEKRVDADGNALLRVGSAEAKTPSANRLVMTSAPLTSASSRKPTAVTVRAEHGKANRDGTAHASSKAMADLRGAKSDASRDKAHVAPHWSYDGDQSPEHWATLSPEWAACAKGTRQSPIDIHEGIKVDLESIRFEYRPSAFTVTDNGHTIQVNLPPGNAINVSGRRYELLQFHFHKPAEERVDGKPFDMVVHLVHKDADGKLAVVAVLLEQGSAQAVVQNVWNHLPLEKGDQVEAGVPLDPTALLPTERGYYTYMGSLTTPPCSEGVLWMVMKQPVGVSPEQLAIFARLYPMNARPLQADSSRLIKESN